jgi:hypothetical protein
LILKRLSTYIAGVPVNVQVNRPYLSCICSLDLGASFRSNRGVVPAEHEATSQTAIGGNAHHGRPFTTTHWSVVLQAQGESPAAQEALEKLCRTYWWPLYGYVRRQGYNPEEAQDLTQGFFALLLERKDFDAVRREKGRLRSYLLTSLKNFLEKARRRELAVKRGEGRALVSLEACKHCLHYGYPCMQQFTVADRW